MLRSISPLDIRVLRTRGFSQAPPARGFIKYPLHARASYSPSDCAKMRGRVPCLSLSFYLFAARFHRSICLVTIERSTGAAILHFIHHVTAVTSLHSRPAKSRRVIESRLKNTGNAFIRERRFYKIPFPAPRQKPLAVTDCNRDN